MSRQFKLALCQMPTIMDKAANVATALSFIKQAAENGAEFVVLPEMFNTPYSNRYFRAYSEPDGGETWQALSNAAKENHVYLAAGSIPEITDDKVYNTCYIFDSEGKQIGKHRKTHLFDVYIEGGINFQESKTLTAGHDVTVFDTPWGRMGVMICFDMRFSEYAMRYAQEGVEFLIIPAAFNMTTGPAHWERTLRARATDNQFFTCGCAPARDENDPVYVSYANSIICNSWGDIVAKAEVTGPTIVYADIDLAFNDAIRKQLPILSARIPDLY